MPAAKKTTLFIRIGDALEVDPQEAVNTVARLFVDALLDDDRVNHFFTKGGKMDKEGHIKHLSQFVSMAFGKVGAKYNFSKEGVQNLTQAHAGMGITPNDFAIVASHLQGCMEAAKIPDDLVAEGMLVVNSTKDAVLGTETPQPAQSV